MLLALTACGGGGGGDGGGGFLPADPTAGLTSYNLFLSLQDADGNDVTTVTPGRAAILTVQVREANSAALAVEGVIVSTAVEFAVVSPENGSAVTNAEGIATFELRGDQIVGADEAVVTVESPAGTVTDSITFQIEDVALSFDITLLDADGLETTFIAPEQPGTLLVRVTQENPDGTQTPPSSPLVVNAQATFATLLPANGAALTDPDGVATFELRSGPTSGAETINLTVTSDSGDEFSASFPFQIFTDQDGFNISLALLNGNGAITNQIDAGSPGTLRAFLTRSNPLLGIDNQPVAGQILSAVSSDGEIAPENGATLTDETGTATFGLAPGGSLGAQTVTVSVNGPGGIVSAELPYEVVDDVQGPGFAALFLEMQLRNSAGQPISEFARGESGFLRVRVLGRQEGSQNRVLVPGIPVSISAANGLLSPASGNLLTDDSGEANFIVEAGDVSGTDVITASLLGPSGPVTESLSYDVTGVALRFSAALYDASGLRTSFIAPGQPGTLRVTVRVQNPDGSQSVPAEPVVVNALANLAVIAPENGSVITDNAGRAEFTLSAGDSSGADIITLSGTSESGETFSDEYPLQVFTDDDEFIISLALLDSSGATTTQIDPGSPGELVALVRRNNPRRGVINAPVAGQLVELAVTDGIVTPANGARVTNAGGEVRFGIAAGELAGGQVATVTVNSPSGVVAAELPYEVVDDASGNGFVALFVDLSLVGSTGQPVSAILPGQSAFLEARVSGRRAGSQTQIPAPGTSVSLVSQNATLTPPGGNVITDSNGVAMFRVVAGTTPGPDLLSATVVGPLGPVVETLSYDVIDADLVLLPVLLNARGDETSFISPGEPGTLRVSVRERGASGGLAPPASAVVVNASTGFANLSPDNGSAVTNGDGDAFFQLTAGDASGADQVSLSADTANGATATAVLPFEIFTGNDDFTLTLSLLDNTGAVTTQIDAGSPGTLVALLTRRNNALGVNGEPVSGQIVTAVLNNDGTITPANGAALTDGAGEARFGITAGSTLGAASATVSVDGPAGAVTANLAYQVVQDVGGGGFVNLFLSLRLLDGSGNPVTELARDETGTLEVTVEGRRAGAQTRVPAAGIAVTAAVENGIVLPEAGGLFTDTDGIARFTVSAGDSVAGSDVATATVVSPAGPISQSISYNFEGGGLFLETRLLDGTGTPANVIRDGSPLTLEVSVVDANSNPLGGVIVEASTDVAELTPANGRALTDDTGVARFTLSTGTEAGAGTVNVTVTAEGTTVERNINYQVFQSLFDLELTLVDGNGNPTTLVTTAQPATLLVQAISLNVPAQPVSGFVVSATGSLVEISPSSGTALTDQNGIAEFVLSAADAEGAESITVSLDTGTGVVTESIGVQVNAGGLNLGGFIDGTFTDGEIGFTVTDLPFGGATRLNLAIVDDLGNLVVAANQVRLTSDCSIQGEAGFRNVGDGGLGVTALVVDTDQGLATAEYNAISCEGADVITATVLGENLSATGTVNIAPLTANYVGFVQADPAEGPELGDRTVIAIAGTGGAPAGRPEVARITFEVLASRPADIEPRPGDPQYLDREDRVPLANAEVVFELTNDLAGIEMCDPSGGCVTFGTLTMSTGANGLVTVEIRSGNVPAQTYVVASYVNPDSSVTVDSASNQVVVSTGLPDQNSVSISVGNEVDQPGGFYVANAANLDGVGRIITARLADRFNNPVPDGTTVIFRTEYGAIDSSCETGKVNGKRMIDRGIRDPVSGRPSTDPARGTCSVLWESQAPRFPDFLPSSGEDIVTIFDPNYDCPSHNGAFGPCPDDLRPVRGLRSSILAYVLGEEDFFDANGNGLYDAGETFLNCEEAFIDFNEDGEYTETFFEEFIDIDNDNAYSDGGLLNGAPVYNGTLCTQANEDAGVCSRELINVRDGGVGCAVEPTLRQPSPIVLSLSGSAVNQFATLERTADDTVLPSGSTLDLGVAYAIHVADQYNNRPGNGTEVTVELDDSDACVVIVEGNFIGGPNNPRSATFTINDAGDRAGATTISPVVVTNELDDVQQPTAGTVLISLEGVFLTSFSCL